MAPTRQQRRAAARSGSSISSVRRRWPWIGVGAVLLVGAWVAWSIWGGRSPARDGAPSWSADGSQIVFYSEQPAGGADLFSVRPDGGGLRALTRTRADEGAPALSPDGSRVAFDSDADGNFEIYAMPLDGSGRVRLTNDPARDVAPAWSPDGTKIAFMSDRASKPEFDVFVMDADGSGVERVTTSGTSWFPQYSPDGTRLAFHVGRDVHVLDLASRRLDRLTTSPMDGMYPSWSPDGRRLAFMSARNGPTQLFTMNADGSDQRLLLAMPTGSAIDPRWSPDGTRIVFVHVPEVTATDRQHGAEERAIYVLDLQTGKYARLSR
jgi:Tol biopolymer transport system component